MSAPCSYCGVRPDVACKHRPATGEPPVQMAERVDRRKRQLQGLAFHPDWLTEAAVRRAAERLK